eukprot:TRINITY_DN4759_c0_g1_i1.p1 TRINITY_DN4759_c0_g1~~TRINITY_DN4759_c0_g1_i1.p1  ORF type:complete len:708 (-),score=157.70 TRINITY_DN4759_c0_g1_i1:1050-3173(-)
MAAMSASLLQSASVSSVSRNSGEAANSVQNRKGGVQKRSVACHPSAERRLSWSQSASKVEDLRIQSRSSAGPFRRAAWTVTRSSASAGSNSDSPLSGASPSESSSFLSADVSRSTKPLALVPQAAGGAAVTPAVPKKFLGQELTTLKKVIPLGVMFFCILFNYTILRDTKDVLVVTAPGSGAEIIPFLKTWVNLPMAIGFMVIYSKMSNVLTKPQLFYACIIPFITFFWSFAFVMYPLQHILHPTQFCVYLLETLGPRFMGPISILRNWTFCLFYVMAELWGSVVVSVLFWGFANQITSVDEAKQFYPLFGLGANVALIASGWTVKYFSQLRATLAAGVDGWGFSLKGMMSLVVGLGLIICGVYYWVDKNVVNDPSLPKVEKKKKKEKPKMNLSESISFLLKSRYIRDLATIVVAYGISINLVEVTWKGKIKAQYPDPNQYSAFMGDFSSCTGIVTFGMMLLSRVIFRKFGWGVAAAITPTVLLITGVAFFGLVLFSGPLTPTLANIGLTPLFAAVLVGAAQNIFSKSAKYSLFDPCKEMAYIPLDEETKVKGKAAIDVVCNPLGKSGGALIQQFLIFGFGSLANSTPYLGIILLFIVLAWLNAARSLDSQFSPLAEGDFKEKLGKGKLSAMSAQLLGQTRTRKEVAYRFVSVINEQGFIEGRYVPIVDGQILNPSAPPPKVPIVSEVLGNDNGSPGSAAAVAPAAA